MPRYAMPLCKCAQSCPTLCNPMDGSPPGSSVHGILQAGILEWDDTCSSRDLTSPGIKSTSPVSPELAGRFFTTEPPTGTLLRKINSINKC